MSSQIIHEGDEKSSPSFLLAHFHSYIGCYPAIYGGVIIQLPTLLPMK